MASRSEAIDWESIRYFLRAAQAKSLSRAARGLRVEHTTVGRRLSNLERAVGAALVDRGPSGLELTALGERVHRLALQMDGLAHAIGELAVAERKTVRVVVPTGFIALLTPRLGELGRDHPDVALDIVSSARRVDLRKGKADLAIRVGPVDDQGLIVRKLGDVGSALYASRGYLAHRTEPVLPDTLRGHSLIAFHRSLSRMPAAEWLAARADGATVVMRGRDAVDMVAAARGGAGIAVLPCFLADREPSLLRITPQPIASRRVSLVYRPARLTVEVRAVISFIVDVMRSEAPSLRGRR